MRVIDDLVSLVPPPVAPVDGDGDWDAVETELGIRLPADFKLLVARYGVGCFEDITLLSPFDTHPHGAWNLVTHARKVLDRLQSSREAWPEIVRTLYPEPGGLLEWAFNGNGDSLCWITDGEPDNWPVMAISIDFDKPERYDMGAVKLLYEYFSGHLEIPLLAEPPAVPWFDPYRERTHVYVQLSDGELPFDHRLQILHDALHPTADRGAHDGEHHRQHHFKATARDWELTYEVGYGHQIRVAFPPEHDDEARTVILDAVRAMGCEVLGTTTVHGIADWSRD